MTRRKPPLTLATITPRERHHLETCVHEAAHAVAGVALGGQLRSAVVSNSRVWGVEGLASFADTPHGRDPEIAYAGPWAQAKFRAGGRDNRPTQRQVLAILNAGGYRDDRMLIASGGTHLGHFVTPLIERTWPAVMRVARRLYDTGEATHADVCAALGLTDDGGPGSVQLANLRAGMRPVPA
ncbi:hypothetical protein HMPREF0591_5263 [Mycobacterium parascrofulaceum ATCC BAA-614]|uniref:Peptidase M41 domain-containing protein n=1 Tax=Mycobacterium parascrofulaceum ATCC BAA-614 TaxID=525368 RepID=D5PGG9_9MYCO|nr:hypothetical protein [Mycobacterium parascrofulaceum]EFG74823.1 hypothetical protein HMPREF0591_5263 [Mycobacterium parascrofulaceum ATCC BAA-614]